MPTDAALLDGVPFFKLLSEQEREALARVLDDVRVPAGQTLFEYGDPGDAMYVIRSGEVEIFVTDDTGTRIALEGAHAGDFFGEVSLLAPGPRTATVIVKEELDAIRLDRDDLDQFLRAHPTAALDLLTVVGHRLRESSTRLRQTTSRNVNALEDERLTLGQRIADGVASTMGSWRFIIIQSCLLVTWIILNVIGWVRHWDPYPFILLNLALSFQAAYAAPVIMMSQNRQAAKDRLKADIEYNVNLKAELEIANLHRKLDRLTAEVLARLDGSRGAS